MSTEFRLIGSEFSTSTFGTSAFGTAAFGGSAYDAEAVPTLQIGSDVITEDRHKVVGEIRHERYGLPVTARAWDTRRRWRLNWNLISGTDVDTILAYFEARVFLLLPTGRGGEEITVLWLETEFSPQWVCGDNYALSGTLQEVTA